jgi:ubiquinol-cytochrome c reductase iron-sulfur subunit
MNPFRLLVAGLALLLGRGRRKREREVLPAPKPAGGARSELAVFMLLGGVSLAAVAFGVVYFTSASTPLLGLTLGLAFVFAAAASIVFAKRLLPEEEVVKHRPELGNEQAIEEALDAVEEGGRQLSRKRLLLTAAGGAGAALGAAAILPALSLGPSAGSAFSRSPWRRGSRLVDEHDHPLVADEISVGSFRTAFPEGVDKDDLASPVVVVRIPENELDLPHERSGWAPRGIVAYSKVCTHAACAVALFRYPSYNQREPGPALVCPCHYSTFDVARGGLVTFGPAGRALPQLPLEIDPEGKLVAGGGFSGRVGPSWLKVRK